MNLSDLRTLAASFAEDPSQSKFSPTKYNDALNKANLQFAMDSKALYQDQSITIVVGTAQYSLPSSFMLEKEVWLNGIELSPISRATLGKIKTGERWDDDTGTPKYYIIDPEVARQTITLYPKPDSIADGDSLVLTFYPFPATLTIDADIPLNGSTLMYQFHTAIAAYAAWMLLNYLQPTDAIQVKKGELMKIYTTKVTEAIQTFGNTKSEPLVWRMLTNRQSC